MKDFNVELFCNRIREARNKKGITQKELSQLSGVSTVMISAYERSNITSGKNPALNNIFAIAEALDVSIDWLCGRENVEHDFKPSEYLKALVKLDEANSVACDTVNFLQEETMTLLPNAKEMFLAEIHQISYDIDLIRINNSIDPQIMLGINEIKNKEEYQRLYIKGIRRVLAFKDKRINDFMSEWVKMRDLYKAGTIDKSLYDLWLSKQYEEIDENWK